MKLNNVNWDKKTYDEFLNYLYSYQDLKYRNFHNKLNKNSLNLIGIRTPILKDIAKEISKGDYNGFLNVNRHNTYEETMIHGLILGYIKIDFSKLLMLLDNFIPYIDNWAVNDTVCSNLKAFKKNNGFSYALKCLNSSNPWQIRFGIVLVLCHYVTDDYINNIIDEILKVKCDDYYVYMALAWLISVCFIKYPDNTIKLFKNNLLDVNTNNAAIRKIKDSYRVTDIEKEKISKYYK